LNQEAPTKKNYTTGKRAKKCVFLARFHPEHDAGDGEQNQNVRGGSIA